MNTNPAATTVLCFGDSNTYGQRPDAAEPGRLPADQRWTGRLQNLLGDGYYVIEEGLNGRTTDLDYPDRPGCNGRTYLWPCLLTHGPLDFVVIMLGSNDLKHQFGRTAADIAAAVGGLLDDVARYADERGHPVPAILLVNPILLDPTQPGFAEMTGDNYGPASLRASQGLGPVLREVAETRGVLFADATT